MEPKKYLCNLIHFQHYQEILNRKDTVLILVFNLFTAPSEHCFLIYLKIRSNPIVSTLHMEFHTYKDFW